MDRRHTYDVTTTWTGNLGTGTSSYRGYSREHEVRAEGRPLLPGSSDPAFLGDPGRWNPELLLVASLSQCHMLWYLHIASAAGVVVTAYTDEAVGTMHEEADGTGRFTGVELRPRVEVAEESMLTAAENAHAKAHDQCFIARSVAFPVSHSPLVTVRGSAEPAPQRSA
ncbi:OsmC family protein [Xylanimonas sp. McL0601]|uniref:OsmC family protein n=1 Tax=Xylanimonas sp. McL0601 TaxID=3414739 RepID=UPI003CF06757